jgi:hypothetical protein
MYRWSVIVVLVLLVLTSAMGLKALTVPHSTLAINGGPVPPWSISGGPVPTWSINGGPVPPWSISAGAGYLSPGK